MTDQPLSLDEIIQQHRFDVVQLPPAEAYANCKAALERLLLQEQINLLDYFDQVPDNNAIDWKSLFADTRKLLQAALTKEQQ